MENINQDYENRSNIERLILILFSLYSGCLIAIGSLSDWDGWAIFLMTLDVLLCWIIYIGKFRDYRSRGLVYTSLIQLSILLYATRVDDMFTILPIFIAFVILTGFYGISDMLYSPMISGAILIFYHGVIVQTLSFSTPAETIRTLLHIVNLFLVQFVVRLWVIKRNDSNVQFVKTIENLKEVERSKDDFMANVSHEIRTPINTICGMSEIALKEDNVIKIKEEVLDIQTAGHTLMSLVSDILDFSELQSGNVELEEEEYNITSSINDVIQMAIAKKGSKNIRLMVDCDPTLPRCLYGDEKKIRRVIVHLVNNAIKFTSDGYVKIGIFYRKEAYGVNLIIDIEDTGIGMSEESLEKLFTSFNQVDTRRNRLEGGIGLGLAMSQALVQKMGGVLNVKSEEDKGTSVKVVIPQKVVDEGPIADIVNHEQMNAAIYLNMEQFEMPDIRDAYADNIRHMIEGLKVRCVMCRSLSELKRRDAHESFTHIFATYFEYQEDSAYFNELAERTHVVVVIDRDQEKGITSDAILRVYKPLYLLPIVSAINGSVDAVNKVAHGHLEHFIAPSVHVLVVDDNLMNIKVVESLLDNYQIKVTKATSGKEALEKITSMNYDFIFMDHMMPEMDGVETFHRIRKKIGTYYQKVPVIALTANAIAGSRERFLAEGFNDFVEKPIELSVLERVLKRNIPAEKLIPVEYKNAGVRTSPKPKDSESIFGLDRLDTAAGLLYCGGETGYLKVLKSYSQSGDENRKNIEELYQNQDWKDYTIAVHAVKSAMLSIGAKELSEMAMRLEAAGKSGDIDYILKHHEAMLREYKEVITYLQENSYVGEAEDEENITEQETHEREELPELAEELADQMMVQIEEAMLALDGGRMAELVTTLQGYQYNGTNLKEILAPVQRKIQMSDYMSAGEMLAKMRERMRHKEKGGEQA